MIFHQNSQRDLIKIFKRRNAEFSMKVTSTFTEETARRRQSGYKVQPQANLTMYWFRGFFISANNDEDRSWCRKWLIAQTDTEGNSLCCKNTRDERGDRFLFQMGFLSSLFFCPSQGENYLIYISQRGDFKRFKMSYNHKKFPR